MPQQKLQFSSRLTPANNRQQRKAVSKQHRWWGPVWRGLLVEPSGKHYRAMRMSVWLYLYLVVHADRKTGRLYRFVPTIAGEMGVSCRTISSWLARLRRHRYITTESGGRSLKIAIEKWKPLKAERAPSQA